MDLNVVILIFEAVILLFSLSLHESAHAWMAARRGDPTALMLGRVSLNPLRHIDPVGTILLPAIALFAHLPLIGWAKPTPVNTRNFKNYVKDDILTTLAGPASNLLAAVLAFLLLVVMAKAVPGCEVLVRGIAVGAIDVESGHTMLPLVLLLYLTMQVNLFLAAFNLLPVPPLDGSHVFRHMIPYKLLRLYDQAGMILLILLFVLGGSVVRWMVSPVMGLFRTLLFNL